ncbi:MAG: DDE-type integrase/transposase/recombinase [bacterium]|nr:DDE-type integrase/transposase/recombinase [bacterium]
MRATRPNELWGIDMTKVMIENFGWVYLVIVIDWYTKKIVDYSSCLQSKTYDWHDWLDALDMALNNEFADGVRGHKLKLMSDNGSQPTSTEFIRSCGEIGIKQVFTSYNNPKGNVDTERVIRTLKEDCVWPHNFTRVDEFETKLEGWIKNYNEDYPHSSLGYKTPSECLADYYKNEVRLSFGASA